MDETPHRITQGSHFPTPEELATWLGATPMAFWERLERYIDETYPGIFVPEGIYGGQKHGWSLRYKKSKSFCTLIPERRRFALLLVFGRDERAKVETLQNELSPETMRQYYEATTYHDGKWLLMIIDKGSRVNDVVKLFEIKRKPKR